VGKTRNIVGFSIHPPPRGGAEPEDERIVSAVADGAGISFTTLYRLCELAVEVAQARR
jgi:hypothetical protein